MLLLALVGCVFITQADIDAKLADDGLDNVDRDGDTYVGAVDCDDTNASIYPGAPEVVNGVDDNCDGTADEGTLAFDDDGDGFCEEAPCTPLSPGAAAPLGGDCDDAQPSVYPSAPEICDRQKNDCDVSYGERDDHDGDGFSPAQGDPDDRDPTEIAYGILPIVAGSICDIARIQPGSLDMGCEGPDCPSISAPAHPVSLSHELLVMQTEVTREQWYVWMSDKDWAFPDCGGRCPVTRVSVVEAMDYANRLNAYLGLATCELGDDPYACEGWRLPTEAEWEYVARANRSDPYSGGTNPALVAWLEDNSEQTVHPVGGRAANAWDVYDLTGNVWEWTWDAFAYYPTGADTLVDPYVSGDPAVEDFMLRGGSGNTPVGDANVWDRVDFRADLGTFADQANHALNVRPWDPLNWIGFRLVRTAP